MEVNQLKAAQIVALLKTKSIIGYNPAQLRKRLRQLNREAFNRDKKNRNE